MDFYLVRHGEAVSETLDPRRPLSRLGREQVERVARLALAKNPQVSAIFHSGILRAKQTAEILAEHLGLTVRVKPSSGLLPEDDPSIGKGELEAAESSIMMVGHLPHMNRLAALLVNGDVNRQVVGFGPATVVCCSRAGSHWEIAWILAPGPV
jgi:phosphohistidine phosphatase